EVLRVRGEPAPNRREREDGDAPEKDPPA
ncbi:MAG: hypothetical protein AVDCRST_MAG12-2418, partial [uncultured Rubrobacteraceae bacterium]